MQGFRVKILAWFRVAILCQMLVIILGIINYKFGANYMYLAEKPIVENPMIIGEWPWYIFGFELIGAIHILFFYFGYRRMRPVPY